MSFFSKIFRKDEQIEPEKQVIDRESRVKTVSLENITLKLDNIQENGSKVALKLENISAQGLAFIYEKDKSEIAVSTTLQGVVFIRDNDCPVSLEVRYVGPRRVGCLVKNQDRKYHNMVNKYFLDELAALDLHQVKSEKLKNDPDGVPAWFFGDRNYELYYVEDNNQVVKFNLSIFGNIIDLKPGGNITCSTIIEDNTTTRAKFKKTEMVETTSKVPADILEHAKKFVSYIEDLNADHREQILKILEEASS
ncbi:MAG: hypothetical protein ISR65_17970 [Bacteriovoracaceae bacterium]|nr:hypothetical protein [Bacteriovoracaceae bacterium]